MRRSYNHTHFAYEDTEVQGQELHTTHPDLEILHFFVSFTHCLHPYGQLWHLVTLLGTRITSFLLRPT